VNLCAFGRIQFVTVEVDFESDLLSRLQNLPALLRVENSFFAKHVNIFHVETFRLDQLLKLWNLLSQNVLCRFLGGRSSEK